MGTNIPVTVVREDNAAREFFYRSPHFEFRCDARLGVNVIREFARIYETTFEAVKMLPLQLNPAPPDGFYVTRLFGEDAGYFEAGGLEGSAGCYVPMLNQVLVPLSSLGLKRVGSRYSLEGRGENHTLLHEITHQLLSGWDLPVWLNEGLAEYIASAPYRPGRILFTNRLSSITDYVKTYKDVSTRDYRMPSPVVFMEMEHSAWNHALASEDRDGVRNYASALLLTWFFCHADDHGDGRHLFDYLAAIKSGAPEPETRAVHLVRGRSAEDLENDMARAWKRGGMSVTFSRRVASGVGEPQ